MTSPRVLECDKSKSYYPAPKVNEFVFSFYPNICARDLPGWWEFQYPFFFNFGSNQSLLAPGTAKTANSDLQV
jgi:hypothetical protein